MTEMRTEPAWVIALKESERNRARAYGIAQVAVQRQFADKGELKVVNGQAEPTDSILTNVAICDAGDLEERTRLDPFPDAGNVLPPPSSPPPLPLPSAPFALPRSNTAETIVLRSTSTERPLLAFNELIQNRNDKPFTPSLATIERSVAAQVYFEQLYHGLLRRPRARDQRRLQLEKELARLQIPDAQRRAARAAFAASESAHLRETRERVDSTSFIRLKTLGHGAFGVVSLVRERESGHLRAMKRLAKADMLRKGQEGHVKAERDVLAAASTTSRWLIRLVYSFQDVDHLYLVTEYAAGGASACLCLRRLK